MRQTHTVATGGEKNVDINRRKHTRAPPPHHGEINRLTRLGENLCLLWQPPKSKRGTNHNQTQNQRITHHLRPNEADATSQRTFSPSPGPTPNRLLSQPKCWGLNRDTAQRIYRAKIVVFSLNLGSPVGSKHCTNQSAFKWQRHNGLLLQKRDEAQASRGFASLPRSPSFRFSPASAALPAPGSPSPGARASPRARGRARRSPYGFEAWT